MSEWTENQEEKALTDLPDQVDVIGVSFRDSAKIYHFAADGVKASVNHHVIVETARGLEYGKVSMSNRLIPKNELVLPLKKVIRLATPEDDLHLEENHQKEDEAYSICQSKIAEHNLNMKLIDVEYTFDNAKLLFYFTSDDRVDFRELVKDLASVFRTRIELRQIGIRDETKLMSGLGVCYREYCCHSFLNDFAQVSIKMAKEQGLSLNSAKISGACGRLMCCLRFEHDTYQEEIKRTPKVGTLLVTPDGTGIVIESKPLVGLVKVKLDADPEGAPKVYDREIVRLKTEEDAITQKGERVERRKNISFVPFKPSVPTPMEDEERVEEEPSLESTTKISKAEGRRNSPLNVNGRSNGKKVERSRKTSVRVVEEKLEMEETKESKEAKDAKETKDSPSLHGKSNRQETRRVGGQNIGTKNQKNKARFSEPKKGGLENKVPSKESDEKNTARPSPRRTDYRTKNRKFSSEKKTSGGENSSKIQNPSEQK
jgi:cell fate regulator YaaT (PSP1 superfamily)